MECKNLISVLLFCWITTAAQAQYLRPNFDQAKEEITRLSNERQQRVSDYLKATGMQPSFIIEEGRVAYMVDVIEGKPVYIASLNADASRIVGVNSIRRGGAVGLDLEGEGMTVWVWDSPGGARISHQEYGGRVEAGFDINEAAVPNYHSTHVTGTIFNSGISANAKGMAPKAKGVVFDSGSALGEAVVELEDHADILVLSNHSYGQLTGWDRRTGKWEWFGDRTISNIEDAAFGFYSERTRQHDLVARNAPNYLMVFGAGNDRDDAGPDGPAPDGPYDCISALALAKNVLTVGATKKFFGAYTGPEQVEMSTFSSWGPTDDGRIKPDITAPGVSIRSSDSDADDSYRDLWGTSMAAPVVTGGLTLIQELHMKMHGEYMRSAALKALTIHTAHEAGRADGPDYEFGWGLFNAEGIARLLVEENNLNKDIVIGNLTNGETNTYTITPDAGTKVKVTLAWTDLAGTPVDLQLDPQDLMLVNDLDIRAVGATESHMPWVMNPAAPAEAASKGDNFRDNVEKIEFTAVDDTYTITIDHKNTIIEEVQEYALIIEYVDANAEKNLYWVGNSGDWSDGANWAISSGGRSAGIVPSATDRVVFDENSFLRLPADEDFNITLPGNVAVAGFQWFSDKEGDFDLGGNQIIVGGDVVVLGTKVSFGTGNVIVNAPDLSLLNLGEGFEAADVIVNAGENGRYKLVGDLKTNSIVVQSGELLLNGNELTTNSFALNGGTLNATDVKINVLESFHADVGTSVTNFENSELVVPTEASGVDIDLGGAFFPADISVLGSANFAHGEIRGLRILEENAAVNIITDFSTGTLEMSPATSLNLGDGNTFTVTDAFTTSGTDDSRVSFNGNGSASLNLTGLRKVCTDFLAINGMNYEGEAALTIGENSIVTGSATGWNQISCDDLLFADFAFEYGCVNSITQFSSTSSGQITGQHWNFGESGTGVIDSELQNPTYTYTRAGVYGIALTVSNDSDSYESVRQTRIIENTIDPFAINQPEADFLISDISGESYQWYLNGKALPGIGATNRQLQVTQSGIYTVQVFDETCNRFSQEFAFEVTSVDVDPEVLRQVEEAVNVFPNPTRDYIDLTIEGYNLKKVLIELVDQGGKVVSTSSHEGINGQSFSERMKLSDIRQGFYMLRFVVNDNIIVNRKVILAN